MADSPSTSVEKPLHLKQVRILNYAPLLDATVGFQQGLNIIIGPNGVGKTRFLSLASQLLTSAESVREGADCELLLGLGDEQVYVHFQELTAVEEIERLQHPMDFLQERGLEVRVTYRLKEARNSSLGLALWQAGVDVSQIPMQPVEARHGIPLQGVGLADSPATITIDTYRGRSHIEPKLASYEEDVNQPLLIARIFNWISASFLWHYRKGKRMSPLTVQTGRQEIERVMQILLEFLNPLIARYSPVTQIRLSNTYQVYDNRAQQEIIIKGLILEYQVGDNWLPFSVLSDGTKRMMYLITQLVMPSAQYNKQGVSTLLFSLVTPRRIIFLEEPELGIHPHQLHLLLQLIREVSRTNQIIMTTHSPQVLDMLEADELDRITICSLEPEKGTQFHKLSEKKQEQARVYMKEVGFLSDYWRYSYLEDNRTE